MDTVIEVVAAGAVAEMTIATVRTQIIKITRIAAARTTRAATTSILRSLLSRGSTSVSAVSPDHILQGGMTVA